MSDTPEAAAPAKKSPMMLIIILLVVVGGGAGAFMFMGGGEKKKKSAPPLELGEVVDVFSKDGFTTNLANGVSFLQGNVSFGFKKGFKTDLVKKIAPALQDTILRVIMTKQPEDLDRKGLDATKVEIAKKANALIRQFLPDEPIPSKVVTSDDPDADPFDSNTGPVVQVYFTKFAMQ